MKILFKIFAVLTFPSIAYAGNTEVLILDATIKDKIVSNAEVILQKNGEASVKAKTNSNGKASINTTFADNDDVTMIVKAHGYSNMVVKCPCDGLTYAISPNMKNLDGMRVVLTWGETPNDLDSHLSFAQSHIYYSSKEGDDANLDVDDTDSFGPETVTIEKKKHGEKYYYAVHNFTDKDSGKSDSLSKSGAKVFVYVGSTLVKTYYIPENKNGTLWTVFYIDENGQIVDVNKFSYETETQNVKNVIPAIAQNIDNYKASDANIALSKKLNRQGEEAYHAKNLDKAISLYQEAINLDANNGQAYSNLGLAFQKNNNEAEAIWANRKAIALADGRSKNTIQASSYFNIAKIYEAKGEYAEALRNYEWALEKKQNDVYVKAIERMNDELYKDELQ